MESILRAVSHFDVKIDPDTLKTFGGGHINDTYIFATDKSKNAEKYIIQAVNTNVFKNPEAIMDNIRMVSEHIINKTGGHKGVMHFIPTTSDRYWHPDRENKFWRLYRFVEAICLNSPESLEDFYQCGYAFGEFQKNLSDFPADKLNETIPDFHNTPKRFENFLKAVDKDVCGRAKKVVEEINFIKERKAFYHVLFDNFAAGKLPLRVTHNDTKINNVLLDLKERKALCVIDLDTIMPGFSVNDFGDAIRFGASTAAEDEKDLDKVWMDLQMFEAYTNGFIDGTDGLLTNSEIELLPEGAKMMTIECGMRFLTDYLEGDTYFKTSYNEQNLDRCRTQLKLVYDMEQKWNEMKTIVRKHIK